MSSMGWACHPVGILANHSLDILATLGVMDGDAVTAVKNGQAVVAEIGAWFDNELHMWFYFLNCYNNSMTEFLIKSSVFQLFLPYKQN